jgi:hypothetical protein
VCWSPGIAPLSIARWWGARHHQHRLDNCCWTVSGRRARNTARFPPEEWSVQRPDAETKAMFGWAEGSVCLMTRLIL